MLYIQKDCFHLLTVIISYESFSCIKNDAFNLEKRKILPYAPVLVTLQTREIVMEMQYQRFMQIRLQHANYKGNSGIHNHATIKVLMDLNTPDKRKIFKTIFFVHIFFFNMAGADTVPYRRFMRRTDWLRTISN